MTVINTNTASINAQFNLSKVNKDMESAMAQLSSGKRINSAADDAAGLSIATRMESQVRGLQQSINNAQDGISLVQSVEGALQESTNIMQRMYELSVQASNSTYTDTDRSALQSEISQLQTELDRISSDTEFNGQKILDGSFSSKNLSVGFNADGNIALDVGDHSSAALSAEGAKDATATLMGSVSNIALGADTQAATTSTAQMAVVKADTQAATITQSQANIGFDVTQSITSATEVRNIGADANTKTAAVVAGTVAAGTPSTTGHGGTVTVGAITDGGETATATGPYVTGTDNSGGATGTAANQMTVTITDTGGTDSDTVLDIGDQDVSTAADFVTYANSALTGVTVSVNADDQIVFTLDNADSDDSLTVDGIGANLQAILGSGAALSTVQTNDTLDVTIGGTGFQVGATIGVDIGAGPTSVNYTIAAGDIGETDAETQANIATGLAALIDADGTYTTSRADNVLTLSLATAGDQADVAVVASASDTAVAAHDQTFTFTGDYNVGDEITITGRGDTAATESVTYTVTEADLAGTTTQAEKIEAVIGALTTYINGADSPADFLAGVALTATNSSTVGELDIVGGADGFLGLSMAVVSAGSQTADAAGVRDTQVAFVNDLASEVGEDAVADLVAYKMTGAVKSGDVISFTANGANAAAVTHTVDSDDLVADDTQSKRNALDSFVEKFNNADVADRFDAAGGVLTASRSGDDTIVFTASVGSATNISLTAATTNRTPAAPTFTAAPTVTAANGAVGAKAEVVIGSEGNLQEGDVFVMAITGALGGNVSYEVTREDIGTDSSATLANVRQKLVDTFNAADPYARQDADSGVITASLKAGTTDTIVFQGSETTNAVTFAMANTITARTETVANGFDNAFTQVTQQTNTAGTATGPYQDGNQVATATTKQIEFYTNEIEEGDQIDIDIAGTTISHTITATDTATSIADALVLKINNVDGQGENVSSAAAGTITASAAAGVLTLTSELLGSTSDFDVSVNTTNNAGAVQKSRIELADANALEEGDKVRLALSDQNYIEVEVTKEMVDAGDTAARKAVIEGLVAQSHLLESVTLSTVDGNDDQIQIDGEEIGIAFTPTMTEIGRTAGKQVDTLTLSGIIGKGDVFTLSANGGGSTETVSVTVTDEIANLRTNDERLTALRDALLSEARNDTDFMDELTSIEADGDNALKLMAATAGTALTTTGSTTTNNTIFASQVQIDNVALSGDAEEGDVFSISLDNGSSISYTVTAEDAAGATADDRLNAARDGLIAAAASGLTGVTASASDNAGEVVLTSTQAGVGFETSVSTSNANDVAQIENVAFANVEAGDSFSVTIGEETATYTAVEGDDAAAVAAWMESNASFTGKSLALENGQLTIEGAAGEAFTVSTATTNFAGGVQSDVIALSGTVETNDVYSVDIDGTKVSYSVQDADVSMDTVVANLAAAINASDASANVTASVNGDGNLALTSNASGVGYTASLEVSDVGRSRNSVAAIDISTEAGATAALDVLVGAMEQVGETRSSLGAIQNRLDNTINNLSNVIVNTEAAQSQIEDADFAQVTGELTKAQIMSQAATAMLAQANASKQGVLSLLQG